MKRNIVGSLAAMALVIEAGMAVTSPAALAQTDGDEKCSPDGYVMRYSTLTDGWMKGIARCRPGNSRSDDDDRDRSSSRRDDNGSGGQPEDGDEKCVGGKILKYHRYDYFKSGWSNTYRDC